MGETEAGSVTRTESQHVHLTDRLDSLVRAGTLKSWQIVDLDEEGVKGRQGRFRNTQELRLTFPDGTELEIGTFCSGSAENTCFV